MPATRSRPRRSPAPITLDRHALYEAAVQNVEFDCDLIDEVFAVEHGRPPVTLREDFCGTASLCAHYVQRREENRAWGLDLDGETLDWGREHRLRPIGEAAARITLRRRDVLLPKRPLVEVQTAFNFSYCVIESRPLFLRYLRNSYRGLVPGGMLFLDLFGGCESMKALTEGSRKPGVIDPDGRRVPPARYVWQQASYNAIDANMLCYIHFEVKRGNGVRRLRRAFRYDWRIWTLPELADLAREAGYEWLRVYVENDQPGGTERGVSRRVERLDNADGWLVYLAAKRPGALEAPAPGVGKRPPIPATPRAGRPSSTPRS